MGIGFWSCRTGIPAFDHAEPAFQVKKVDDISIANIPDFGEVSKKFYKIRDKNVYDTPTKIKDVEQMYARWAHLCILDSDSTHYEKIKNQLILELDVNVKKKERAQEAVR